MSEDQQEIKKVDVLIQGGGIGGLSLAAFLQRKGYVVEVVERSLKLSEIGAGIWMAPNPLQAFKKIGLDEVIVKNSWPVNAIEVSDHKGRVISHMNLEIFKKEFGYYTMAIYRGRLQQILFDFLAPGTVIFGVKVHSWKQISEGLEVQLSNGQKIQTKLLIGADGLHSEIREKLFPESEKRYSGSSSYRAIVDLQEDIHPHGHLSREIWAPGCRLGFSRISATSYYWYLTFDSVASEKTSAVENFKHAQSLAEKYFSKYKMLIERADPQSIIRTDISDLKPLKDWRQGRVGLIGDAAHATTPNLGQGGAQAVEDAGALAEEICSYGLTEQALRSFIERRQEKARWIVNTSWSYRVFCHLRSPVSRSLRNILFWVLPKAVTRQQLRKIYRLWN